MGEWIWLTRGPSCRCLITGLPEGEGFRLHRADEAGRFGTFPGALIAARPGSAADPPALARQAVALADDQHRELGLAPRAALTVDVAEHCAQRPHLRPREAVAEML